MCIFGSVRELNSFFNILNGDETLKNIILVHKGKLLDLMTLQDTFCFLKGCTHSSCYKILMCHNFFNLNIEIMNKA
ncbi:hypothetical protein D3C76_1464880 [compost metagenome]